MIFLTQLHHGMRPFTGPWIAQSDRAHRTKGQRIFAAVGHLFDRHAAREWDEALEGTCRHALGRDQSIDEPIIFLAREWEIKIIVTAFPLPRGSEGEIHVDRIGSNDGGNGIVKVEVLLA